MTGESKFRGVIGSDYDTINKSPLVFPEIASNGIYACIRLYHLYHDLNIHSK